jgi:hypothetical protein
MSVATARLPPYLSCIEEPVRFAGLIQALRIGRKGGPMSTPRAFGTALLLALISMPAVARPAEAVDQLTPVLASVLTPPAAVLQSDGVWRLPYEIELTNVTGMPMTIESLEVLDPARDDALVATLSQAQIATHLVLPGGVKTGTLGPGQSGLLLVNTSFKDVASIPEALAHRLVATTPKPTKPLEARTTEDNVAATKVTRTPPIVLGPPLRGERWVAEASCCESYHRKAALPVNGARRLAQRFAIDWIQLDEKNRLATGDPKQNGSYPQFGAEALAVADAKVAHVRDGFPEGTPGAFPAGTTLDSADGNSVILDLGGGRFALYAHLQPGSIRVEVGDAVKRGQVLGLVGNTGNSDAPHLHFHVMDGASPLASNGLPYAIDAFEVMGRAVSSSDLDDELKKANEPVEIEPLTTPSKRANELPANLAVIRFPPSSPGK